MRSANRTRITIETEKILVLAKQATEGRCQECGQEVPSASAYQAKESFAIATEKSKLPHQSKLHLGRARNGLVICLKSLLCLRQAAGADHDRTIYQMRRR